MEQSGQPVRNRSGNERSSPPQSGPAPAGRRMSIRVLPDWCRRLVCVGQQEHRPQRPTENSDPTHHAKGRVGDRPGPRKGATTRRNVTQGGDCEVEKQGSVSYFGARELGLSGGLDPYLGLP